MLAYVIRRMLYILPILFGVNVFLFILFFYTVSPDTMAERLVGGQHVDRSEVEEWKRQHDYHLPRLFNTNESGLQKVTETIFWKKNMPLFLFRFGKSDASDEMIGPAIRKRIPHSLYLTVPIFLTGILVNLVLAMIVAFYRGTYIDFWVLVVSVVMMSISVLFYIIGGQYLIAITWRLVPVSGYDSAFPHGIKFLLLPILVGILGSIGAGVRYYRTVFLEEINRDYVRTARAKGLGEGAVLFKHVLKNAMLPILTNVVVSIPFLIMGNLLLENFCGIPGLGSYLIDAFNQHDFAVIRAMVFLSAVLYVFALLAVDISYTLVDPRVRLQ